MKTIVLLINFLCLTPLSVLGQDTLTVVYVSPKDTLCEYYLCRDTIRSEYDFFKTLYGVKTIKELTVDETSSNSVYPQPMIKFSMSWQKGIFTRICLCSTEPCLSWQLLISVSTTLANRKLQYLIPHDSSKNRFKRYLEYQKILVEKKFDQLPPFKNVLYSKLQLEDSNEEALLIKLLQNIQDITPNTLTMIDVSQKKELENLVKKHQKGDILLSLYKGKATIQDNYSGLILTEFDLGEFEKKQ